MRIARSSLHPLLLPALALAVLPAVPPASRALAQDQAQSLRERWRERIARRMEERMEEPPAPGSTEYSYGKAPLQTLDYWPGATPAAPLILFVHGGGWERGDKRSATGATKVEHWRAAGYAVASVDYRLVPDVPVEQAVQDVADALGWLRSQAPTLHFDPNRIILVGHSAGAHIVALIGTDTRHYLDDAHVPPGALRGIVALDGAAYDVPAQLAEGNRLMQRVYDEVFGGFEPRQRDLSPTLHATDSPNAAPFLILHVQRPDGIRQAEGLAAALRKAGTPVTIQGFPGEGLSGHMEINRSLGDPAYPATAVVDRWMAARLAR